MILNTESIYNKLKDFRPTWFRRLGSISDEDKADLISKIFGGKTEISNNDINLLISLSANLNVSSIIQEFMDIYSKTLSNKDIAIPIYLDIFNKSNVIRKEYIEVSFVEELNGNYVINLHCLVVPLYSTVSDDTVLHKIENIIDNHTLSDKHSINEFCYALCNLFKVQLTVPVVDTYVNYMLPVDKPRCNVFMSNVGRIHIDKWGSIILSGSYIFLKIYKANQLYTIEEKVDLCDEHYKQHIVSTFMKYNLYDSLMDNSSFTIDNFLDGYYLRLC